MGQLIVKHCLHLSKARSVEECEIMFKLLAASCLVAAACGQFAEPKNAKILKEQRFNAGDGRFGSAFAQEDGTVYREETTADGERIGQYSYIDNDGKTITVRYTAGKDEFRILEGAHVPLGATGQESAAFVAEAPAAPVQVSAPVQVAAPVPKAAPVPVAQPIDYDYVDEPVDPNFNPFINPHDSSHQQAGLLAGHQAGVQFRAQAPAPTRAPVRAPVQPIQQTFTLQTTPAPKRFFPPGQLKLNRFESGFNFDFSSQ